jgi:aminoglycoside 6-adenylyltransferase
MAATHDPGIARIVAWGESRPEVRALVLSSSRTNPTVPELVDALSDYDLDVIIAGDARCWYEDRSWLEDFGPILTGFVEPPGLEYGIENFGCVILFQDGIKIDFTVMPVSIFRQVVAEPRLRGGWDDGHQILLDKDQLAEHYPAPTHREYIPSPPGEQEYRQVIDYFFTETTYVAKYLWRDELLFAKNCLDAEMKGEQLRRMLEWRMEIDYGWSVRLGLHGRGLKKRLPAEIWSELESTYVGASPEENWDALWKTIALFRKTAVVVGDRLGYPYPDDLDRRVYEYARKVKNMPRTGK